MENELGTERLDREARYHTKRNKYFSIHEIIFSNEKHMTERDYQGKAHVVGFPFRYADQESSGRSQYSAPCADIVHILED